MMLTASSCLRYLVLARMGVGPALGVGDPIDLSQGTFVFDSFTATSRPVDTNQALDQGWTKATGACDPALGEAWLLGGELSPHRSATLYFTPAVGGAPGVLSGVAAHYYDTIPAGQVGTFFSPAKEDSGGRQYHSVAVALYDTTAQDVCDDATPLLATAATYLAVVSHDSATADRRIPTREDDAELNDTWMEGSCIRNMGYHWLTNVAGGDPSYDHDTMLPVVAMYHPDDKSLTGWFFWGAGDKREWDDDACPIIQGPLTPAHLDCLEGANLWDVVSLAESNANTFPMPSFPLPKCVNTCDLECSFQGSTDGRYTTMHWWVQDVSQVACPGPHPLLHCRNNFTLDQYNSPPVDFPTGAPTAAPTDSPSEAPSASPYLITTGECNATPLTEPECEAAAAKLGIWYQTDPVRKRSPATMPGGCFVKTNNNHNMHVKVRWNPNQTPTKGTNCGKSTREGKFTKSCVCGRV